MSDFDLDERMTDETRFMVINSLKVMRPSQLINIDINMSRQFRVQNAQKANESLSFNGINVTEFTVKNKDDKYEILVTCYKPDNCKPNSPITIFFHGGGWTFNNVFIYSWTMQSLASSTSTVWLSVEYRLSPEYKFPVGLNDCKYVLDHVYNNKSDFSSIDAKIGLSGDSSGGHYAALLANEFNSMLDYQILIYPCVQLAEHYESQKELTKDCYILVPDVIDFFVKNLFEEEALKDQSFLKLETVSPIYKECFKSLPKTLIIAAECDPLVDHSIKYHEKLQQFNVESELKIIKGTHHGFFNHPVLMKHSFNESQQHIGSFLNNF